MTTQELEAAILEGVQASYKKKYIGKLKVQKEDFDDGTTL